MTAWKRLVGASVAAVATLAAGPHASAQVKIGSVLSVTGPASFLGDPEKKTLDMYVEEINAKGGVNGQKLQLIVYDDGGDASNARTFATRLVEDDKIVAMVGGTTTGATLAMNSTFTLISSRWYQEHRSMARYRGLEGNGHVPRVPPAAPSPRFDRLSVDQIGRGRSSQSDA